MSNVKEILLISIGAIAMIAIMIVLGLMWKKGNALRLKIETYPDGCNEKMKSLHQMPSKVSQMTDDARKERVKYLFNIMNGMADSNTSRPIYIADVEINRENSAYKLIKNVDSKDCYAHTEDSFKKRIQAMNSDIIATEASKMAKIIYSAFEESSLPIYIPFEVFDDLYEKLILPKKDINLDGATTTANAGLGA